jgi:hypothetical protein
MGLTRREILTSIPLFLLLLDRRLARAGEESRRGASYRLDADVFFGLFVFNIDGYIEEQIDRAARRYRVVAAGRGSQIANRLESSGIVRDGRFLPTLTDVFLNLRGRESRTAIAYDHDRGLIDYHHVSETFFLGRRREVHDLVRPNAGQQVDDLITTALNYAEGAIGTDAEGSLRTYIVRRTRPENESPDDVQPAGYRAEIVPLIIKITPEAVGGREVGRLDLTRLSSWARRGSPLRIAFGADRRPESIQAELLFGSSVRITVQSTS